MLQQPICKIRRCSLKSFQDEKVEFELTISSRKDLIGYSGELFNLLLV